MGMDYHDKISKERSPGQRSLDLSIRPDIGARGYSPYQASSRNGSTNDLSQHPKSPALPLDNGDASTVRERARSRSGDEATPRGRSGRHPSGSQRICKQCGEPLTGQFVRALDGMFHLDCFKCKDCGQTVASKFFPAEDEIGGGQHPLCETDYFRRLGLLCHKCNGALRGSYITALDQKYHVDHFTCSLCTTVFGAADNYYEHSNKIYCHYHYSTQYAQKCNGCQTAILKQFVEIFRNGQDQHWHPECYMIHKFWNVRLGPPAGDGPALDVPDDPQSRADVRLAEEKMEAKVYRIWSVLSTFEESSAACISDMLLHVSNGAYVDGVAVAKKFICHVEILFNSADRLDRVMTVLDNTPLSYGREAKLLCKKIVQFFTLLSKTQDKTASKLGVTQELLQLVTGLAHYLKLLIRICLQGALRVEKEKNSSDALHALLDDLANLESLKNETGSLRITAAMSRLADNESDHCMSCHKAVEDECAAKGEKRWHLACMECARCGRGLSSYLPDAHLNIYDQKTYCRGCSTYGSEKQGPPFERVSRLQQYIFLLQVALAQMLSVLRESGALVVGEDTETSRGELGEVADFDRLQMDGAQASQAGERDHRRDSSYENTLNDVRRLRSTRLDKHLSTSFRKARTSRLLDAAGNEGDIGSKQSYRIEEDTPTTETDKSDLVYGHQDALTLDDIPRIVAAEQAREMRPVNRPGRQELFRSPATEPYGLGLHKPRSRSANGASDQDFGDLPSQKLGGQKFLSELSPMEYFIVRHLAVLTMLPMVEHEFSLQELLGFIESKKPAGFWGKWFKNDPKKGGKKKGNFGVPLEQLTERDGADSTDGVGPGTLKVPAIVDDIVSAMRKMDLGVEGIFRKNGNIKKLGELCEQIDREGCDNVNLSAQPVIQLAALFKRYLRELPDPLMTHKLYRLWIVAAKIQDDDTRRQCLHLACCLLSKSHRDAMEVLFCFLKFASTFAQMDDDTGSKMDVNNLATVIAPSILLTNTKGPALDSEPMYAILAVEVLLANIEEMCLVPDDLVDVLNDPTLFSNNGDITSKELLRRFGGRVNGGQGTYGNASDGRNDFTRPHARRVETAPSAHDVTGWPSHHRNDERSTSRPANGAGTAQGQFAAPYSTQSNPNTPPSSTKWRLGDNEASPYRPSFDVSGEANGNGNGTGSETEAHDRREWRNSGYGGRTGSFVGVGGPG